MSLVVENEYGYVICHQTALGEIYGNTNCNRMDCVRKFKTDLFNIITPFKMDSQVKDENGESVLNSEESQEQKKKRKVRSSLNFYFINPKDWDKQCRLRPDAAECGVCLPLAQQVLDTLYFSMKMWVIIRITSLRCF